ncbi:MAG: DUF5011 domain-containing protein [Chitinophagales bacterium]
MWREDLSTPVIVLDGDDPLYVDLGSSYTDPGFTATDDEDGDISADVTVDATAVNTNMVDKYEVSYSVSDKAGNVGTAIRNVWVRMFQTKYVGSYSVHEICDIDGDGILGEPGVPYEINDYTVTVSASGVDANTLIFTGFGAYDPPWSTPVVMGGDLNDVLTVSDWVLPGTSVHVDADGVLTLGSTTGIEFDLDYVVTEGTDSVPCEAHFTKL